MPQLHYGNIVFLRVLSNPEPWLSGARGNGQEFVVTRDGENSTVEDTYKWSVRQTHDDASPGTRGIVYGDYVYLKNTSKEDRWLCGGRGNGNAGVRTRDGEGWTNTSLYQWRIQVTPNDTGSGPVSLGAQVYLKLRYVTADDEILYLTGGRGGDQEDVYTRDGEGWTSTGSDTYLWEIGLTGP